MSAEYDSGPDTEEHIEEVRRRLLIIADELRAVGYTHDASKLGEDEKPVFDEVTPRLKGLTYGSEEYKKNLGEMGTALAHHYAANRHHPEHFKNGVKDMNLVDIVEMLCDWCAAATRHADGDVMRSIEINQKRFGYTDELKKLLCNTVAYFRLDNLAAMPFGDSDAPPNPDIPF